MKKIGVIMGGISTEREISLKSGENILKNLDKLKYEAVPIIIDSETETYDKIDNIDFAFIALHGKFGEDGTIQRLLEIKNIPYNGCGPLSSAICMDKDMTKRILRYEGIPTGDWVSLKKSQINELRKLGNRIKFPVVVKPNNGGSSVATNIARDKKQLYNFIEDVFKVDEEAIIEEYISGEEYTCCILKENALPIIKIKSNSDFFDYKSKYDSLNGAEESIASLDSNIDALMKKTALKCFKSLKCSVYARVDIILKNNIPYVLEINTLPGMTEESLFPKSAKASNIEYSKLLDEIINASI